MGEVRRSAVRGGDVDKVGNGLLRLANNLLLLTMLDIQSCRVGVCLYRSLNRFIGLDAVCNNLRSILEELTAPADYALACL